MNADPEGDAGVQWDATLAVIVGVVDGRNPQIPDTMRTTTTLLGVSAGAATADQLARVAVSADSGGREITGILVADPDSADATTGRSAATGTTGGTQAADTHDWHSDGDQKVSKTQLFSLNGVMASGTARGLR